MIGTKLAAEAADLNTFEYLGGRGAFYMERSVWVTARGQYRSDYADMSNEKQGENPCRRNPKGSWGRFVRPGLVGP